MKLSDAINETVSRFGLAVLPTKQFINLLDDIGAFKDEPATKYIFKTLLSDGTIGRFVKLDKWNIECEQFISKIANSTGFQLDMLNAVFKEIAIGLDWPVESNSLFESKKSEQRILSKKRSEDTSNISYSESDLLSILRKHKFIYEKGGKYGIMNYAGEVLHAAIYNEIDYASSGLIPVRKGKVWGYIDSESSYLIEPQFNDVNSFWDDRAVVKNLSISDREYVIDTKGNMIIPPIYDSLYSFHNGLAKVIIDDLQGYIDINGEVKVPIEYPYSQFPLGSKNEILVTTEYGTKLIDNENSLIAFFPDIYFCDYDSHLGDGKYIVYQATDDGTYKYGIISNKGHIVIPCRYDDLTNLSRYSEGNVFLGAKLGNKYGVISKEGKLLVAFQFDDVYTVTLQNYFIVKKKNKWGIVDIHGKTIIPFIYEEIRDIGGNVFHVKIGSKEGRINTANEWLPDSESYFPFSHDYELIDDIYDDYDNKIYICHKGRTGYIFNEQGKELLKFKCPTITHLIFK